VRIDDKGSTLPACPAGPVEAGDPAVGTTIAGKYRLVRLIGKGGMGAVYEARHLEIGKRVAIKLMRPEFATEADVVERFRREARAASATGHTGILQIHDIGIDGGRHFMVMDLLEGETLDALLRRQGRIEPRESVRIMIDVLGALSAVHEKGIVHRDIKPENIFIARDDLGDHVKILDFGISRRIDGGEETKRLTSTGMVLGTPYYLSPEQARGRSDVDARVDVYACGVMLYQMLSGKLPYNGETIASLFYEILSGNAPRLESLGVELPEGLADVVHAAMAPDRDHRWHTSADLRDALTAYQDPGGGTKPMFGAKAPPRPVMLPPTPMTATGGSTQKAWSVTAEQPRQRRRGLYIGLTLAVLVAAGGAAAITGVVLSRKEPAAGHAEDTSPAAQVKADPVAAPASAKKPTSVKISITGLPEGSSIFLGDRDVGNPATLSYGTDPVGLRVAAPGYDDKSVWITPDRDVTMPLALAPVPPGSKAGKRDKDKAQAPPAPAPAAEPVPPPPPPQPVVVEKPPVEKEVPEPAPEKPKKKGLKLDLDWDKSKEREAK